MTRYHPQPGTLLHMVAEDGEPITLFQLWFLQSEPGTSILLEDGSVLAYSQYDSEFYVHVYAAQIAPKL